MLLSSRWNKMNISAWPVFYVFFLSVSKGFSQDDRFTRCGWNVTKHGCPEYDDYYWKCLRGEANCPSNTEYHCARLDWNRSKFGDGCYSNRTCDQGKEPYILNDWDIKCDWCFDTNWYNSKEQVSSTYSKCEEEKMKCNVPNGVECKLESDIDKFTKNRQCRCDARNNYVMPGFEEIKQGVCTSDAYLARRCERATPCGENQERLLNYTCANKCVNGYRPKHSDECIPDVSTTDSSVRTESPESSVPVHSSLSTLISLKTTTQSPSSSSTTSTTTSHVPNFTTEKTVIKEQMKDAVWKMIAITFIVVVIVIILIIVVVCVWRRWKKTKNTHHQNGTAIHNGQISLEEPPDNNVSKYEVRILVKKDYDFTDIERARPNIASLEITERLQKALHKELSKIPDILNIEVKDIRKGSLLVIYIIETQASFKKSDLRTHLDKLGHKGAMGEFQISHIMLIPWSRRDSIIDISEKSVENSGRRRSLRQSHSQLSSMLPSASKISEISNGLAHFPKAEHEQLEEEEEPLLEDSGFVSPRKNDMSDISEAPQTPVFTLDSPPIVSTSQRPLFSNYTKDTVDRTQSCSKDRSQDAQKRIRRISSSHNDLSLMDKVQQKQQIQKHKSQQHLPSDPEKRDEMAKKVLKKHYDELLSCLQPDRVLDKFIQRGFMKEIDIRDIREKRDTSEKNRCIINRVIKKGYDGYVVLKEVIHSIQLELSKLDEEERKIAREMEALEMQKENNDTSSDDETEL